MTTEERLEKLEKDLARVKRFNRWLLAGLALDCPDPNTVVRNKTIAYNLADGVSGPAGRSGSHY